MEFHSPLYYKLKPWPKILARACLCASFSFREDVFVLTEVSLLLGKMLQVTLDTDIAPIKH